MTRTRAGLTGVALAALLAACGGETAQETEAHPVVVQAVLARDLEEKIEAAGELVARHHAVVAAEVGGRITAVLRDEGSDVAEGEAIVAIDPERRELETTDARAQLAELQAAAAEAGREQKRIRVLHEKGVASQARLEQTETQLRLSLSRLDAARARLGMFERALADAQVRAPFAGVVAERLVEVGEFVQPGTRLFALVALDPIEVEFRLPEADASRVQVGQEVALRVAPYPDQAFRAEVVFVSPTIDTQSRTLLVRGALPNPERLLRPGLFAGVDLGVASRNGVAMIPEEAVLQRADGEVAFRMDGDNKVQRVVLETGIHRGGEVEVRSGLEVGDRVVVSGHYALAEGMQVEPRTAEGEPETAVGGTPRLAETSTP